MKITSQRTLIWVVNFAFFGCLVGLVMVMVMKYSANHRKSMMKTQLKTVDARLKKTKYVPTGGKGADAGKGKVLDAVMKGTWGGYVKPKPVKKPDARPTNVKVKPLSDFIEVIFIASPNRAEATNGNGHGPAASEATVMATGAQVKIKSLPEGKNIFYYREGDTIGTDAQEQGDKADDLKQHGGAVVVRLDEDSIVCQWAEREDRVEIGQFDESSVIEVTGAKTYGKIGGTGNKPRGAASSSASLFQFSKDPRGRNDTVSLTQEGLSAFQGGDGEKLLNEITFDSVKSPSGGKALQIKSIPSGLKGYGLQPNDVIIKIDNRTVSTKESIVQHVRKTYKSRRSYRVTVLRDGKQRMLTVRVPQDRAGRERAIRGLRGRR